MHFRMLLFYQLSIHLIRKKCKSVSTSRMEKSLFKSTTTTTTTTTNKHTLLVILRFNWLERSDTLFGEERNTYDVLVKWEGETYSHIDLYFFVFFYLTQGFFIFVFHGLSDPEVKWRVKASLSMIRWVTYKSQKIMSPMLRNGKNIYIVRTAVEFNRL